MGKEKLSSVLQAEEVVEKSNTGCNASKENSLGIKTQQQVESLVPTVADMSSAVLLKKNVSPSEIREYWNWLIHQLFIRQEYIDCLRVVEKQLQENCGVCEYALYVKGLLMRRNGELTESFKFFQTAMLINPQNILTRKQVAQSLFLLGKHRAAIEAFKEAEKLRINCGSEGDWMIYYSIGMCYMHLGEYENAKETFLKSISVKRQDCSVMQLGKTLVMQKDYEHAISLYEEAVQTSSTNSDLLTTLGLLYIKVGNTAKAFNYVGKCLTFDSSNPTAIMVAASIMQENGDFSVALNKYRIAISKLPHSARLWSNIGMCFFAQQKNMYAAVACLQKAISLSPFEWRILYNIGLVFLHLKQYASAFHYLSASTHIHNNYAPAFMYLGICLALMDDVENACRAYSRALSIEENPLILINYTITLLNCGRNTEAYEYFQRFLLLWKNTNEKQQEEFGPSIPNVAKTLTELLCDHCED